MLHEKKTIITYCNATNNNTKIVEYSYKTTFFTTVQLCICAFIPYNTINGINVLHVSTY